MVLRCCLESLCKALLKEAQTWKAHERNSRAWWEHAKTYASLVLPLEKTEKCFASRAWVDVQAELIDVTKSKIGMRLFGRGLRALTHVEVTRKADEAVGKLKGKDLTKKTLEDNKKAFLEDLRRMGRDPNEVWKNRTVIISYRGVDLKQVPVVCPLDEYMHKREAYVRSVAVDKDLH